ncbi:MAG: hypothetical protein F2545_04755 [Actinobacteria bacterium]|uniref:Unannotated protein n=1 Tax=freshwater metagenome TaxID=449393 RepID=A0A6J6DK90_9ZZZZ|nr:hypothetical protein [Actinomycetota bacterium]
MSTRKLIFTALICGLAIMLAGGIKLLQVANDDTELIVHALGVEQTLSDMTVSVMEVVQSASMTAVTISAQGVQDADPVEGWRLLAGGEVLLPLNPQSETCLATDVVEARTCVVEFPPSEGSVTVAYIRAGAQSQWAP